MPAISLRTCSAAKVALAAALFFAVISPGDSAAPSSREPVSASASAEIGRIVGNAVEIHAVPSLARDSALPAICKMLAESFHEAAREPGMREQMDHIVHEIVIEPWTVREAPRWVTMHKGVMTVQTLTDPAGIEHLRPLIVQVLKEKVQMTAKPRE